MPAIMPLQTTRFLPTLRAHARLRGLSPRAAFRLLRPRRDASQFLSGGLEVDDDLLAGQGSLLRTSERAIPDLSLCVFASNVTLDVVDELRQQIADEHPALCIATHTWQPVRDVWLAGDVVCPGGEPITMLDITVSLLEGLDRWDCAVSPCGQWHDERTAVAARELADDLADEILEALDELGARILLDHHRVSARPISCGPANAGEDERFYALRESICQAAQIVAADIREEPIITSRAPWLPLGRDYSSVDLSPYLVALERVPVLLMQTGPLTIWEQLALCVAAARSSGISGVSVNPATVFEWDDRVDSVVARAVHTMSADDLPDAEQWGSQFTVRDCSDTNVWPPF